MFTTKSLTKFTISFFNRSNKQMLGRWKINDNQNIKATLANMDCCGDKLCGTPANYTNAINKVLKK